MKHKYAALAASLIFVLIPLASAGAYYTPYYSATVTAPYWCGSYYSSYPCPQYQYQYQYTQQYSYYPSYPYSYNYSYYNYNAPSPSGYWGYCYQTVAPTHGPSYRYPCYQQYDPNYQYYYYNAPYNVGVGYPLYY